MIKLLEWRVSIPLFASKNRMNLRIYFKTTCHLHIFYLVLYLYYYEVKKSIVIPILQVKQAKQTQIKTGIDTEYLSGIKP